MATKAAFTEVKKYYRTAWISDVHLGFKGCQADYLLEFLEHTQCETLYLVGDIIDMWSMKKGMYWPQSHNAVLLSILKKAQSGTRVVYVPGNHDEMVRDYADFSMGNIEIRKHAIHETADGRKLLMMHGDEFDGVVRCSKAISLMGSKLYEWLLWSNRWINYARRKLGKPYWSLAGYLKHRVKNAVNYISNFEAAVAYEARKHGVDGLVCGHIHRAEMSEVGGVLYLNDGDWVESCTALVECYDGSLELIRWTDKQEVLKREKVEPQVQVA